MFGVSKDKDIKGITKLLDDISDTVILTKSKVLRAEEPKALADNFLVKKPEITDNVEEAIGLALNKAHRDDLILITGSLFIVAEAMKFFRIGKIYG